MAFWFIFSLFMSQALHPVPAQWRTHKHASLSLNLLSPPCIHSLRCWSSWLESGSCGWTGTDWRFYLGYDLQSFLYTHTLLVAAVPPNIILRLFPLISNLRVCLDSHQNEPQSVCIRLSALWTPAEKELQFGKHSLAGWIRQFYRTKMPMFGFQNVPIIISKRICSCEVIIFLEHN